ncbi:gliding motility protein GldM [Ichthyobacterium seriolicida]|uniref:Gliding motility protein GldM n=2 Tax=Ichthyobacterium seriolicida TaxID=242600 RepID=A0A1J1DZT7_9FLAO|nr:gliding motility protein GldM [Ichthyobacterium seriolicida]
MLALNVSRDVLVAFGALDNTTVRIINNTTDKNNASYGELKLKNDNNPLRYKQVYESATEISKRSNALVDLLNSYKSDLIQLSGVYDEVTQKLDYSSMDGSQGDEYFYPGGDPANGKGQEFVSELSKYREFLLTQVDNERIQTDIKQILSTEDIPNPDGIPRSWLKTKLEGFPLIAQITLLSQIQADIRFLESDIVNNLIKGELATQMNVNSIKAFVVPFSNAVMRGDKFKADVFLAAYDTTLSPEIFLYKYDSKGNRLGDSEESIKVKDGIGEVAIPTDRVGDYYWGGRIKIKNDMGDVQYYPFEKNLYTVSEVAAVVSAKKMNIVYRGVKNPISISVPGVPANQITLGAGPGADIVKTSSGEYSVDVTKFKGRDLDMYVSAKLSDGTVKKFPSQKYRVKDIPSPNGTIRGEMEAKMSLSNLFVSTIRVEIPNFEFDLKMNVVSFSIKVPGKPSVSVSGDRISGRAEKIVAMASIGDEIVIRDIKVQIQGNSSYKVGNVSPILVTVTGK